ncbi:hypothetical protein BT69DRAFT_1113599 [Atractiella rhizophila]|nr:hypothetical protein BT69DRAFT_1113599 [Atractiella rhizophila]
MLSRNSFKITNYFSYTTPQPSHPLEEFQENPEALYSVRLEMLTNMTVPVDHGCISFPIIRFV